MVRFKRDTRKGRVLGGWVFVVDVARGYRTPQRDGMRMDRVHYYRALYLDMGLIGILGIIFVFLARNTGIIFVL